MPAIRGSQAKQLINCEPCQRSKHKCNRVKPCLGCVLRMCEDECYPHVRPAANAMEHKVRPTSVSSTSQNPSSASTDDELAPLSLAMALPSPLICSLLIDFAEQMLPLSFLNTEQLRRIVHAMVSQREKVPDQLVSLLFWVLSFAAQNVPSKHRLAVETCIDFNRSVIQWKSLAVRLDERRVPKSGVSMGSGRDQSLTVTLQDIYILTLQALWHAKYGELEQIWHSTGLAIRKGATIGLFGALQSNAQHGRRAFAVAHRILLFDRWVAFNNIRPLGIGRDELGETRTSSVGDGLFLLIEQRYIAMFEWGGKIRQSCQADNVDKQERRRNAQAFLQDVNGHLTYVLEMMRREYGDFPDDLSRWPLARAARLADWRASCAYIACATSMSFIHDGGAPSSLRKACFDYAIEALRQVDIFKRIVREATVPHSQTRMSNQIFTAVRAIFVFLLNEDLLESIDASLLDDSPAGSSTHGAVSSTRLIRGVQVSLSAKSQDNATLPQLVQAGIECIEEMRNSGSEVAAKVLLLISQALGKHDVLQSSLSHPTIDGNAAMDMSLAGVRGDQSNTFSAEQVLNSLLLQPSAMEDTSQWQIDSMLASFLGTAPSTLYSQ